MKLYTIILTLLLLIGIFVILYNSIPRDDLVCIKERCFNVEVADTESKRTVGLMYREFLDQDKGMLFVFDKPGEHGFWMKNTKIPLDIIWVSEEKTIVHIEKEVPPCIELKCESYSPSTEALYVLEINSGLSDQFGFLIGDKAEITF